MLTSSGIKTSNSATVLYTVLYSTTVRVIEGLEGLNHRVTLLEDPRPLIPPSASGSHGVRHGVCHGVCHAGAPRRGRGRARGRARRARGRAVPDVNITTCLHELSQALGALLPSEVRVRVGPRPVRRGRSELVGRMDRGRGPLLPERDGDGGRLLLGARRHGPRGVSRGARRGAARSRRHREPPRVRDHELRLARDPGRKLSDHGGLRRRVSSW